MILFFFILLSIAGGEIVFALLLGAYRTKNLTLGLSVMGIAILILWILNYEGMFSRFQPNVSVDGFQFFAFMLISLMSFIFAIIALMYELRLFLNKLINK